MRFLHVLGVSCGVHMDNTLSTMRLTAFRRLPPNRWLAMTGFTNPPASQSNRQKSKGHHRQEAKSSSAPATLHNHLWQRSRDLLREREADLNARLQHVLLVSTVNLQCSLCNNGAHSVMKTDRPRRCV